MRRVLGLVGMLGLVLVGCTNVGNTPPVPVVEVHPTYGEAPLFVEADASHSFDPDGETLSFSWDFGDGARAEGETVKHRYDAEGEYLLTLTVTDSRGLSTSVKVPIRVGLSYPLDVLWWRVEEIYYGQRVYGEVKNISDRRINLGRVAVRFYDSEWNLVRERSKTLGDLAPGAVQIFEITTDLRLSEVGGAPNHTIYTEVIHTDFPLSARSE